ncbi:hereditary hemochromatosis protein homolog isoform X4 [Ctenopharyngodon idella]|uniref:hereditary hemochromatosis protein homolog isoform X4 n=1 Tax=Ctenopharyngodon idella TaxID=7959 RepID=UPI00222F6FDB|nr:hereditary hemochromatosis protein homolog isoform X4 [Ctenopharyngodon idella]
MASIKVLLLISAISSSQSEMHSLYYMYSVISKSLMSGEMFEFYTSVELSDIQMSLCKSVNKADFMSQLCEESERLFNESDDLHYKQQWLQINLKTLMMEHKRKENSTRDTDLHVLQWRHGCAVERHSNGSVMFLQGTDEYAYDGQTLTFDLSMHWKPLVLDHDIIWDRESVSSLERKCVETLTSFTDLQLEGKFIMESRPDVHTLVKASGSSVKQLLVCLATGFYPKHVQMEIRHNQTPLPDEQLNSDGIRPNADGSFQLMKSLEILPSEASQYRCVVEHQTLIEPQIISWDEGNVLLPVLIGFIVVLVVLAIILLVFYLLRKCVKLQNYDNIVKGFKEIGEDNSFSLLGCGEEMCEFTFTNIFVFVLFIVKITHSHCWDMVRKCVNLRSLIFLSLSCLSWMSDEIRATGTQKVCQR